MKIEEPKNGAPALNVLIGEADIEARVRELVDEIAEHSGGRDLVVIALLKGSFMFLADLVRHFYLHDMRPTIDFMTVSSYGSGIESSGNVDMLKDLTTHIEDRNVLVVDDILDTGRTMQFVCGRLRELKPRELRTCVFCDKPERRAVDLEADYVGFRIPDRFVVGYGLDFDGRYRELPYLCSISF